MSTGTANSMSLLTGLLQSPLDPGYAEAAERRAERAGHAGHPLPERRPHWLAAVGVVLVAAVLVIAAVQTRQQLPAAEKDRARLVDQVQDREALGSKLQQQVRSLRAEVTQQRSEALAVSQQGQQLAQVVSRLESAAGATAVVGPGVTVTVADAADAVTDASGNPRTNAGDASRVTDQDLQTVVNGLWAAGAEAISINGYRLSNLTTIRAAGEAVLVDFHPLSSPYRVVAIGPKAPLRGAVSDGTAGRYLAALERDYGITHDVATSSRLTVPAAALSSVRLAQVAPGAKVPGVTVSAHNVAGGSVAGGSVAGQSESGGSDR
ncbi:MAG: DUF881 domain-containing protein [Actinomycetes bacterium]